MSHKWTVIPRMLEVFTLHMIKKVGRVCRFSPQSLHATDPHIASSSYYRPCHWGAISDEWTQWLWFLKECFVAKSCPHRPQDWPAQVVCFISIWLYRLFDHNPHKPHVNSWQNEGKLGEEGGSAISVDSF